MRDIPSAFTGGAMTLARCWLLTRRDGFALGFTDHDDDLIVNGVTYFARTGLSASDMTDALGLEVTGGDISGALTSLGLTEEDIAAGLYDGARIDLSLVDWSDSATHILLDTGKIGEIRRHGGEFICEIRGLAAAYQEEKGRLYQHACSADLGDTRCGLNLADERFHFAGLVTATDGRSYLECDAPHDRYDFNSGRLVFLSGANAGLDVEIKSHVPLGTRSGLWLWQVTGHAVSVGDSIRITVGCDKSFETCGTRFANRVNFRGFPHIPGTDFILHIVKEGDPQMDGGSLFL